MSCFFYKGLFVLNKLANQQKATVQYTGSTHVFDVNKLLS